MSERKLIIALLFFFLFHFISIEFVDAKTFSEANTFEKVYWISGSVLITPIYIPLKALYTGFGVAASGAVLIGTAGFGRDKAFSMAKSSIGGDWFIHPDYLMGNRKLNLFEPTIPAVPASASMPATTPAPGPSAPEITPAPQTSSTTPAPEMSPAPSVSPQPLPEQTPGTTTLPETPQPGSEVTPSPKTSTTPSTPETPSTKETPTVLPEEETPQALPTPGTTSSPEPTTEAAPAK